MIASGSFAYFPGKFNINPPLLSCQDLLTSVNPIIDWFCAAAYSLLGISQVLSAVKSIIDTMCHRYYNRLTVQIVRLVYPLYYPYIYLFTKKNAPLMLAFLLTSCRHQLATTPGTGRGLVRNVEWNSMVNGQSGGIGVA